MWDSYKDAAILTPGEGASGPGFGFLDAFDAAYQAHSKAQGMFSLEAAFQDAEWAQRAALMNAGVVAPRSLAEDVEPGSGTAYRPYLDAARFYSGDASEPSTIGSRLAERDTQVDELRKKYPDLGVKTYRELWRSVQEQAQTAERRWDNSNTSIGGMVGGFLGEGVASIDPRTDPFNTLTLGVGGVGKTIAGRVATEGLGQAGIEAVDQFTGVQEGRDLLGLNEQNPWAQVGMAALFGASFRGAAEGLGYLGKRWFRDAPNDPAPAVPEDLNAELMRQDVQGPPQVIDLSNATFEQAARYFDEAPADVYGVTRLATERGRADLTAVTRQLDDWAGPAPWEVRPHTDTAPIPENTRYVFDAPYTRVIDSMKTPEDLAREADPETFRQLDKLSARKSDLRRTVSALEGLRARQAERDLTPLDRQIAELETKVNKASAKNRKKLEPELAALKAQRETRFNETNRGDTPDMARARNDLMKADEDMRDLAPLLTRAMDAGQAAFRGSGVDAETLQWLRRLERTSYKLPGAQETPLRLAVTRQPVGAEQPITLNEKLPLLHSRPDVTSTAKAGDAADTLARVVEANAKDAEATLDAFKQTAKAIVKDMETPKAEKPKPQVVRAATADDAAVARQEIETEISRAIEEGSGVRLYTGAAKPMEVVAVKGGALIGKDGNSYGTAALVGNKNDKVRVEVTPNEYITLPNGARLSPDDVMTGLDDEGKSTTTIRQMLKDLDEDEQVFRAVSGCSISKPSQGA